MSLTKSQIDTLIDTNCKSSSVSYPVAQKTVDENLAMDKAFDIIFKAGGKWQFDDSNHADYPIITTNLVDGQRDYTFTTDEQGNLILDIYKVMIKDEGGVFREIYSVDQQTDEVTDGFWDGENHEGIPHRYDKTANGIFLDAIPSYNSTGGLKIFINREASYFTTADTTKKPGFAGLFHEYVALRPSYQYAYRNSLPNVNAFKNEMIEMESAMKKYYRDRSKDESMIIRGETINSV